LHGSKYIAIFANDTKRFKILDYSFELWNEIDLQSVSVDKPFMIFRLNSTETDNRVPGFKYFVTHIPVMSDSYETQEQISLPLTFDDIARRSKGDALIGYLKADVDNLGKILTEGFSRKIKFSISTFATLSRMLETFFSGWLQKKTCTDYMDIYSIFSGGDDFFVIGPWNASIDFAKSIRSDFSRYCAENPDMTFSSGIILSKPHEPLSFCAKSVENELAKSKRPEVKNRITLFGQTLQWEELENILNEAKEIIEWLERKPSVISRGFAYNLREYGEMADKSGIFKSGVDINAKFLRFVPLLVHDINRNLKREDQKDAYAWAMDLRPTKDKPGGGTNLPYLKIIMEYVLTYTRGG
jgi:CRISPR-associated protein Csm1